MKKKQNYFVFINRLILSKVLNYDLIYLNVIIKYFSPKINSNGKIL